MFTDFKLLFDAMKKRKRTMERQLMIDIIFVRQYYKRFEISRMGLVKGDKTPC